MIYQPIRSLDEFRAKIQFGLTPESLHLDFKQTCNESKADDLAIDMASFANTQGGVLLFGVSEAKNANQIRVAKDVVPGLDAEKLRQFLNNAVIDRIRPVVRFESCLVSFEGGVVMAVNVEPSIEMVGVCLNRDRQAFSFPYRTEHGNRYMDFAQVEERMSESNTRRSYLKILNLLGSAGVPKQVVIYPSVRGCANSQDVWWVEVLQGSDQVFVVRKNSNEAHMPYSLIEEVWRMDNMETGCIAMRLKHRLFSASGNPIDFDDSPASDRDREVRAAQELMHKERVRLLHGR